MRRRRRIKNKKNFQRMKILIIGAGAFGVSTAIQLQKRFNGNRNNNDNSSSNVEIVVLDRAEHLPAKDAASTDINKVVRADYGDDQVYTDLALESIQVWKKWNKLAKEGEGKGGILEGGDEEFTRGPLYFQDGFLLLTESEELNDMERLSMETLSVKFKNNSSSTRMSPIQQLLKSACDDDDHQVDQLKAFGAKFPAFQDTLCRRNYRNGYLNTAAGWCNSGEAMRFAINMARELGVVFINGPRIGAVTELVRGNDTSRVSGVRTLDGSLHMADVVIVAAGSWTPSLIPELVEGGLVVPTAQPVVHLILPTHLRAKYSAPSCTVWSADITKTGFYGFPCNSDGILKIGKKKGGWGDGG